MSRVWQSGVEVEGSPLGVTGEFTGGNLTSASRDGTIKRSGAYALKYNEFGYNFSKTGLNLTGAALRSYNRISASPGAASRIMGLHSTTGHLASLRLKTDRKIELNLNGPPSAMTLLTTSSFVVPTGSFEQCFELWVDRLTKTVAARYNGTEWARVQVSAFADPNNIDKAWFGPDEATLTGCDIYYDDMAINSLTGLTGPHNNGWCGLSAGGEQTFWPSQDAELSSWTVQGGGSVFAALDEQSPDDATTYIKETAGVNGAAAGFFFPAWPLRSPASAVCFGVRGGGTDVTSRLARLQFHDPADLKNGGISADVDWNLSGWKTVFPMLTVEEALDGTRRMLCNAYLYPSVSPNLFAEVSKARGILVRVDAQVREIRISTVWMTVDFQLPLTANVVPPAVSSPQILITVDP